MNSCKLWLAFAASSARYRASKDLSYRKVASSLLYELKENRRPIDIQRLDEALSEAFDGKLETDDEHS